MTRLIIARHGNTFGPNDTPTRVGKHTDLPLVEKGHAQGRALGADLLKRNLIPDIVHCSTLHRTKQTAEAALKVMQVERQISPLEIFDEIDYGPDENQTEEKVISRIGKKAITQWDEHAIVPQGWKINPEDVILNWTVFAQRITKAHTQKTDTIPNVKNTILVVTSNGIARFAPHLTGNFEQFRQDHTLKLSTGAYGILDYSDNRWKVSEWNVKPSL